MQQHGFEAELSVGMATCCNGSRRRKRGDTRSATASRRGREADGGGWLLCVLLCSLNGSLGDYNIQNPLSCAAQTFVLSAAAHCSALCRTCAFLCVHVCVRDTACVIVWG